MPYLVFAFATEKAFSRCRLLGPAAKLGAVSRAGRCLREVQCGYRFERDPRIATQVERWVKLMKRNCTGLY